MFQGLPSDTALFYTVWSFRNFHPFVKSLRQLLAVNFSRFPTEIREKSLKALCRAVLRSKPKEQWKTNGSVSFFESPLNYIARRFSHILQQRKKVFFFQFLFALLSALWNYAATQKENGYDTMARKPFVNIVFFSLLFSNVIPAVYMEMKCVCREHIHTHINIWFMIILHLHIVRREKMLFHRTHT